MTQGAVAATARRFSKSDFYRYCRLLHGWLSAFAFLILCFFSFTGLLLNHPDWIGSDAPPATTSTFDLNAGELEEIAAADDPGLVLVDAAASHVSLRGEYGSGDRVGRELFVRLQGVRGLSDLRANLETGRVEVVVEPAPTLLVVNELHRAERSGNAWRLFVDGAAILLIVLSIIGYLIFLSMRFRLRTALVLTAASAAGMWALFVLAVH